MNKTYYRITTLSLILLTWLNAVIAAPLTEGPVQFGTGPGSLLQDGFDPPRSVNVRVLDNAEVLANARVLSRVGGGLSVQVASPEPDIATANFQIQYQSGRPDGQRIVVLVNGKEAYCDIYDWEAKPTAEFVNTHYNGMIDMKAHIDGSFEVGLHDAFHNTLLGLRLIQADLIPGGIIASTEYLPSVVTAAGGQVLLGPGERLPVGTQPPTRWPKARNRVVLTDANYPVTFGLDGKRVKLSGQIRYFAWKMSNDGGVSPEAEWNSEWDRSWEDIRSINPVVVREVERAFNSAALFRFMQKNNSNSWDAFVTSLRNEVRLEKISTPGSLKPRL